jgi:hypothetical protein
MANSSTSRLIQRNRKVNTGVATGFRRTKTTAPLRRVAQNARSPPAGRKLCRASRFAHRGNALPGRIAFRISMLHDAENFFLGLRHRAADFLYGNEPKKNAAGAPRFQD